MSGSIMPKTKIKSSFKKQLGIIRSFFIYYLKPFNGIRLTKFYGQFIKKGDLCFDIGAHLGNRTHAWLKMGATVVAVEPQPACIEFLKKKFGNHPNCKLVTKAVGEKVGQAKFRISSLYPTISTISTEWQFSKSKKSDTLQYWDDQIDIQTITLDTLIHEFGSPDFCKIDVEDFELEVLNGLGYPIPALSFEFFPAKIDKAILCLEKLDKLGKYEYNLSFKEYLKLEFSKWLNPGEMAGILKNHSREISGDVYARLTTGVRSRY